MALPATENFTANPNTQVSALTNWSIVTTAGDLDIHSNAACPDYNSGSTEQCDRWNADSFNDDQYAEATIIAMVGYGIGVACRCSASAETYYCFYGSYTASYLYKAVAGSYTQIGSDGAGFQDSDAIRLEVEGTSITGYINDVEEIGGTDSDIESGYAGVSAWGDDTDTQMDDWEGGNLGAAPPAAPPLLALLGVGG